MSTESIFLRYFQNVDRKHDSCQIFKMSTESTVFARFRKCRPKAQFSEIFKMSTESTIFGHFAMESCLRLRRRARIYGRRWVALARRPSSIFVGGLEKRLPFLDFSALLLQFHKTSCSTEDPGHKFGSMKSLHVLIDLSMTRWVHTMPSVSFENISKIVLSVDILKISKKRCFRSTF